ncbi:MAG: hypothetical protein HZB46_14590 [Solirubrobacterales bacterium]|nr:hypothetical protein [Solirubrobacterales bacterium]
MEPLDGIAAADAHLGRETPLPRAPLPLVRWVDVLALGPGAVEVAWSLDDSRPGTPGRLALYAGAAPPPARELDGLTAPRPVEGGLVHREAPLEQAQPSLRPVQELAWERDGLHLRLTAQGPWALEELLTLAASVE